MTIKSPDNFEGVVVKSNPYKESDALLSVYTMQYGLITLHARGLYKAKSKNLAACQTITKSEFEGIVKVGISNLIRANSMNYYKNIKSDIEKEIVANYMLEYIYISQSINQPSKIIYDTLTILLDELNQGVQPKLIYCKYMDFILKQSGSKLKLTSCAHCLKKDGIVGISIKEGGFICQNCINKHDLFLEVDILKVIHYISACPLIKIKDLQFSDEQYLQASKIFTLFIDEYCGLYFKTRKFLKEIW